MRINNIICRIKCFLLSIVVFCSMVGSDVVHASSKKNPSRTDNLYATEPNGKMDYDKDTIKLGNKIYYTLDNSFYCYNIKTKKKNKIVSIPGKVYAVFYSNKCFYIVSSDGSDNYDVYKINIKKKKYKKFLDDIDCFIGYAGKKYWFLENGILKSTVKKQTSAKEYDTADFVRLVDDFICCGVDVDSDSPKYFYIDAKTEQKKKLKNYKEFAKKVGEINIHNSCSYPEKGINNWKCASYKCKNIARDCDDNDGMYYILFGTKNVVITKNKKTKTIFKSPPKKKSTVVCIFDKYIVICIYSKTKMNYVLLDNNGKTIGKLGSEHIPKEWK